MSRFTYLSRRAGGVYYLQIRLPQIASRGSKLWRFSLLVRDYASARRLALTYLAWLIPVKDAKEIAELVEILADRLDQFLLQFRARDANDTRHRITFLNRLLAYVMEWKEAKLCPVEYSVIYDRFGQLREGAALLNLCLVQDMVKWGIHSYHQHMLADWESPYMAAFNAPPSMPEEEAATPGDWEHHIAMAAAANSGATPELIREYFARYRPEWSQRLSTNEEPETWDIETFQARSMLCGMPKSSTSSARGLSDDPEFQSVEVAVATRSTHSPHARELATERQPQQTQTAGMTLSQARKSYLDFEATRKGDRRDEEDAGLVLDFMIDFLGDVPVNSLTADMFYAFEQALAEVPDRNNIPRAHTGSLMTRYKFAKAHGWGNLKPLSETRIKSVYHGTLHKFFGWMRKKSFYAGPDYRFTQVPANALEKQERDAWTHDELIKLFNLPLFTGAKSARNFWTPGKHFIQNELYWAYVLIFFTGMRNSEIASLRVSDIKQDPEGLWNFDLRLKRSKVPDRQPTRKARSSERETVLDPLLIDLGLLERKADLEMAGIELLFPEWTGYTHNKSDRSMPGHHFSKSWQYVKNKFGFHREGLTIYGGRHTRAGWYDAAGIAQRTRNRLLGHAPTSVADGYGPIDLSPEEKQRVLQAKLPIEEEIAEILLTAKLRAEYGELAVVKTWLPGEATKRPQTTRSPSPQPVAQIETNSPGAPVKDQGPSPSDGEGARA